MRNQEPQKTIPTEARVELQTNPYPRSTTTVRMSSARELAR